jgi:glycosyltransferase involved in cell wall biosynthesis
MSIEKPAISIMSVVYNGRKFINRCYKSITDQTFTDWEWVIVDDGSSDGTEEEVRAVTGADPRVRFHRYTPNKGRAHARCVALEMIRGDWICVWDIDDFFLPERLESIDKARVEGYDWWNSRAIQTDLALNIGYIQDFDTPFPGRPIRTGLHSNLAFRADLGKKIGYMNHLKTFGGMGEDSKMLYELAVHHRPYLDERPLMVNVVGHEVVLTKSWTARAIVIETFEEMRTKGTWPWGQDELDVVVGNLRKRNRVLGLMFAVPWLYPFIMRRRKRGAEAQGMSLTPEARAYITAMSRDFPV